MNLRTRSLFGYILLFFVVFSVLIIGIFIILNQQVYARTVNCELEPESLVCVGGGGGGGGGYISNPISARFIPQNTAIITVNAGDQFSVVADDTYIQAVDTICPQYYNVPVFSIESDWSVPASNYSSYFVGSTLWKWNMHTQQDWNGDGFVNTNDGVRSFDNSGNLLYPIVTGWSDFITKVGGALPSSGFNVPIGQDGWTQGTDLGSGFATNTWNNITAPPTAGTYTITVKSGTHISKGYGVGCNTSIVPSEEIQNVDDTTTLTLIVLDPVTQPNALLRASKAGAGVWNDISVTVGESLNNNIDFETTCTNSTSATLSSPDIGSFPVPFSGTTITSKQVSINGTATLTCDNGTGVTVSNPATDPVDYTVTSAPLCDITFTISGGQTSVNANPSDILPITWTSSGCVSPFTKTGTWSGTEPLLNGTGSITAEPTKGTYDYILTGNNAVGTPSSATVVITVNDPGAPPIININTPTEGQVFTAPATINIDVTATDSSGGSGLNKVKFYRDLNNEANLLCTDSSFPFATCTWSSVAPGSYSIIAKAIDYAFLKTSAVVNVVVLNTPPVVTLNGADPITIYIGDTYTELGATATDAQDGDITSSIVIGGDTVNTSVAGLYTVIYSVTDSDGALGSATRDVNVVQGTATISVTSNKTATYSIDPNIISNTTIIGGTTDGPTSVDTTSSGTIFTVTGGTAFDGTSNPTISNTITGSSNTASLVVGGNVLFTLTYPPNNAPTVSLIGASTINFTSGGVYNELGATANDQEQGDLTSIIDTVVTDSSGAQVYSFNGSTPVADTYTVTYTVTDLGGLTGSATRTVVVNSVVVNTPPSITLTGGNVSLTNGSVFNEPGYSATDTEDGNLTSSVVVTTKNSSGTVISSIDGTTPSVGTYTITYDVDDLGTPPLSATQKSRTVTVNPVGNCLITSFTATPSSVSSGGSVTLIWNSTDVAGSLTASGVSGWTGTKTRNNSEVVVTPFASGTYTYILSGVNSSGTSCGGNISVTVTNSPPTVTLNGSATISLNVGDTYTELGATANDPEDGALSVTTTGSVNTSVAGTYTITYSAADSGGLSASVTRIITVNSVGSCTISLSSDKVNVKTNDTINLSWSSSGLSSAPVASVAPFYGGWSGAKSSSGNEAVVVSGNSGTYVYALDGTNSSGSPCTSTVTVTVADRIAILRVTSNKNTTYSFNLGPFNQPLTAGATDVRNGFLSNEPTTFILTGAIVDGNNPVITNSFGGGASQSLFSGDDILFTLTYPTNNPPSITLSGSNPLNLFVGDTYTDPGYSATDTEDGNITSSVIVGGDAVNTSTVGTYVVTYDVTDSGGLSAVQKTRTVTVSNASATINVTSNLATTASVSPDTTPGFQMTNIALSANVTKSFSVTPGPSGQIYTLFGITDIPGYTWSVAPISSQTLMPNSTINFTITYTPQACTINLTANPTAINSGGSTTLTWSSVDAVDTSANPITYIRTSASTGASTSLNIGTAGTNRLVVVMADDESENINLTGVTVDGKACNLVARANNTKGIGNHSEMWYCDESDLGSSSGTVTVALQGGNGGWGTHAQLFTDVSQSGPLDFGIDQTSIDTTVSVSGMNVSAGGLVVMSAGHGGNGSWTGWTSPLVGRSNGPNPSSAIFATASGVESVAQTNKTYVATANTNFNRGTGIVASWDPVSGGASGLTASGVAGWSGPRGLNNSVGEAVTPPTSAGTYTYRLDGVNSAGQGCFGVADVVVTVANPNPPVITINGLSTMTLNVGDTYTEPGATAFDVEDGDITPSIIVGGDIVNTSVAGTYIVTYDVTDSGGLSATQQTRTVNVNALLPNFDLILDTVNLDFSGITGTSTAQAITINAQNGFTSTIQLSISAIDQAISSVGFTFSNTSLKSKNYSKGVSLTATITKPIATGSYNATLKAVGGGLTRTKQITLNINNLDNRIFEEQ